jgi:hypothetical protein
MVERVQVTRTVVWRRVLLGLSVAWSAGAVAYCAATVDDDTSLAVILAVWSLVLLGPPFAVRNRRSFAAVCVVAAASDLVFGLYFALFGWPLLWPLALPLIALAFLSPVPPPKPAFAARRQAPSRWLIRVPWLIAAVAAAIPTGLIVTVLVIWLRGPAA